MKETFTNIDDDIFSELKNNYESKTPKNRLSLQQKLSFYSKSPKSGINSSSKSIKSILNNNDLSSNRSLLNIGYGNNNNYNFLNDDKTKMKIKIMKSIYHNPFLQNKKF